MTSSPDRCFSVAAFLERIAGTWQNIAPDVCPETLPLPQTDSRIPNLGGVFLALKGERFDGHDFLDAARKAGNFCAIINADRTDLVNQYPDFPLLLVPDTLRAYQTIGTLYREKFPNVMVAGVTGSVGKTSVKEMLRAIFIAASSLEEVVATEGNTNNQIGVVQNLFRLSPVTKYAVIEMGTNSPGEIAPLATMAQPQCSVVNSIAPCHLEKLKSLAGVATEKGEIFRALPQNGCAVLPLLAPESHILREMANGRKILTFGPLKSESDFGAEYLSGNLTGSSFILAFPDGTEYTVNWQLTGQHQALNAAAAAAVAWHFGISAKTIITGLEQTQLPGMRMAITRLNDITFVNDAYNANPASMKAALEHLAEFIDHQKWILVLGDMCELGEYEMAGHKEILQLVTRLFPDVRTVLVGNAFAQAMQKLDNIPFHWISVKDAECAKKPLAFLTKQGDTVFLKASRSIGLEVLLNL